MFTLIKDIDNTTKNTAALLELFDISEEIGKVIVTEKKETRYIIKRADGAYVDRGGRKTNLLSGAYSWASKDAAEKFLADGTGIYKSPEVSGDHFKGWKVIPITISESGIIAEQNYEGGVAPTGLNLPPEQAAAMRQAALKTQKTITLPGKGRVVHPGAVVRNKKGQFVLVKKDDIDPASKSVGDTGWRVEDLAPVPVKTLVGMVQKSAVADEEKKNLLTRLTKVAAASKQNDRESGGEPVVYVPKDYVAKVEKALAAQKAVL